MKHIVYETTNKVNGKKYIGKHSTDNLDDGYLGSGKLLLRSINKYGVENFERVILKEFNTEQEAYEYECDLVTLTIVDDQEYYNLMTGGSGLSSDDLKELWLDPDGPFNTERYRQMISERMFKLWQDPEFKQKISDQMKERWQDSEYKQMMSERSKKMWQDPEYRQMMTKMMSEKAKTSEFKEMRSKVSKKLWKNPKYRQKMCDKFKEKWQDPERRQIQSEKAKERFSDPKFRQMVSERQTGEKNSSSKLTEKEVIEIKTMIKDGISLSFIAKQYNVTQSNISCIKRNKSWKHVII